MYLYIEFMSYIFKISAINQQKIPSWKVDIVQNLDVLNPTLPRKIKFSGFCDLIIPIKIENQSYNSLIFN